MPADHLGAALVLALAIALCWVVLRVSPRTKSREPVTPFSGGGSVGNAAWVQFRIRYAVLALIFLAFDMEMVYMFPWAVVFRPLGMMAFLDMLVFLAVLTAALAFAWREGALDWED